VIPSRRYLSPGLVALAISAILCATAACVARGASATPTPLPPASSAMPAASAVPGWEPEGALSSYEHDTLYGFMDGAADLYFTYGFEELAVGEFKNAADEIVRVEVYRVDTDADAYGLFTYNSYGEPVAIGVDGELDSRYRLAFWQSRTFVQVTARPDADDDVLRAFGLAVSTALPAGGTRPALVAALPASGLQPGSIRFFREKLALDNLLWLGPNDVLGLGPDTEGVVARYDSGAGTVDLLLIAFPSVERAQAAQAGLRGAPPDNLVSAARMENKLAAVFGAVDTATAQALLDEALAVP
jgi:hypothetical protein